MRRLLVLLTVTVAIAASCTGGDDRRVVQLPERIVLAAGLQAAAGCDELLDHIKTAAAERIGPWGLDTGGGGDDVAVLRQEGLAVAGGAGGTTGAAADTAESAAAPLPATGGDGFSTTNVQEAGIDEPDILKLDGRRVFAVGRDKLHVIDPSDGDLEEVATLPLPANGDHQLLLAGGRLLVLTSRWQHVGPVPLPRPIDVAEPLPGAGGSGPVVEEPLVDAPEGGREAAPGSVAIEPAPGGAAIGIAPAGEPRTTVTVVDISGGGAEQVAQYDLDGSLVTARTVGDVARVVLRSGRGHLPFHGPAGTAEDEADAIARNQEVLDASTIDDWVPEHAVEDDCRRVHMSAGTDSAAGGDSASTTRVWAPPPDDSTVSVLSIDPAQAEPGPAVSVVGGSDVVYASARRLYVAAADWAAAPAPITKVHSFDITDPGAARYIGSGAVPGTVLNQFAMSEHDGRLRIATTEDNFAGPQPLVVRPPESESRVTVLEEAGPALVAVGEVTGLGKTERIHSVRFIGELAYVVTFRQIDPLYVVDLSSPTRPRVTGELKIPGFSSYLHPIGEDLLLGVGQDATDEGQVTGTQLSVFDVSDPAAPTRRHHLTLKGAGSEAEWDHHAFLHWPETGLTVIPVQQWDRRPPFAGAAAFDVDPAAGIEDLGRISHAGRVPPPADFPPEERPYYVSPVRRAAVAGGSLLTLSEHGLLASDLANLADRAFVPL